MVDVNSLVFYPAIVAFIMTILSAIIILYIYQEHRYIELLLLVGGFLSYSYLPLNHIIFSYMTGAEYEVWRTWLGRLSVISGTLSPLIVWIAVHRLTGEPWKPRHYGLILLLPIVLGYTLRSYSASWTGSIWEINYDPPLALALNGLTIFWALFETIYITYINYRSVQKEFRMPYFLVFVGWNVTLMASIVLIIERVILSLQTRIFIIFGGAGVLILAIALILDPFAIVPRTIGSKLIVISDKESGGEIYSSRLNERQQLGQSSSHNLFSTVMSGVLMILEEITGQRDIPKRFGYANYTIIIEETEHLISFLICDREIHPVRIELRNLLFEIEQKKYYGTTQRDDQKQILHDIIKQKLNFAL